MDSTPRIGKIYCPWDGSIICGSPGRLYRFFFEKKTGRRLLLEKRGRRNIFLQQRANTVYYPIRAPVKFWAVTYAIITVPVSQGWRKRRVVEVGNLQLEWDLNPRSPDVMPDTDDLPTELPMVGKWYLSWHQGLGVDLEYSNTFFSFINSCSDTFSNPTFLLYLWTFYLSVLFFNCGI